MQASDVNNSAIRTDVSNDVSGRLRCVRARDLKMRHVEACEENPDVQWRVGHVSYR